MIEQGGEKNGNVSMVLYCRKKGAKVFVESKVLEKASERKSSKLRGEYGFRYR